MKPPDVEIEDYWVIRDPENTRDLEETYRESLAPAAIPAAITPVAVSPPPAKRNPGRPRKTLRSNPNHRVKKPTTQGPDLDTNTRRSSASGSEADDFGVVKQPHSIKATGFDPEKRNRGRPAANLSFLAESPAAKARSPSSNALETATATTRKRGRPGRGSASDVTVPKRIPSDRAAKTGPPSTATPQSSGRGRPGKPQSIRGSTEQQKGVNDQGKSKVTKLEVKKERLSTHNMRTRANGLAESRKLR